MKNKEIDISHFLDVKSGATDCSQAWAALQGEAGIVAESYSVTLKEDDPTAHAAVNVIREARKNKIRPQKLKNYTLLLSAKPCPMCVENAFKHQIKDLYYIDNELLIKEDFRMEDFFEIIIKNNQ
ncbi:MAG: hypothetical protein LBR36_03285 [Bacteroidales bacterium]|nr:hypothetical protein [Bacteroidales bacterium]